MRHLIRIVEAMSAAELGERVRLDQEISDARNAFGTERTRANLQRFNHAVRAMTDFDASHEQPMKPEEPAKPDIHDTTPDIRSPYHSYQPRGGFTPDKIKRHLRTTRSLASAGSLAQLYDEKGRSGFAKEIRRFSSPQEFAAHLFFHGTGGSVSGGLRPGSVLPKHTEFGGGYGEAYNVISLSKSRNVASGFTGTSSHGQVYPVILRKGAKIISMPGIQDSQELEDMLSDLWTRGVDAVRIGDWTQSSSEQELGVLNPHAIIRGRGESFAVFNKTKFEEPTEAEIEAVYNQALKPPTDGKI